MGSPKAGLELGGRQLVEIAATALAPVSTEGIRAIGGKASGRETIPDDPTLRNEHIAGPLVGMITAFQCASSEWVAILACDLPFVSGELLEYLDSVERELAEAVVPVQQDGWPQPLCALYCRRPCLLAAERMIVEGERSVQTLIERVQTRLVAFSELANLPGSEHFFLNVNTPEDLSRAESLLASRTPA